MEIKDKLRIFDINDDLLYEILSKDRAAFSIKMMFNDYYQNNNLSAAKTEQLLRKLLELGEKGYIIQKPLSVKITLKWKTHRFYKHIGLPFWMGIVASILAVIAIVVGIIAIPKSEKPESKVPLPTKELIKQSAIFDSLLYRQKNNKLPSKTK